MDFSVNLKNLRVEQGYTQQELSDKLGISVVTLRNWERGAKKPNLDTLLSLGKALSVSLDSLAGSSVESSTLYQQLILSSSERKLLSDFRTLDRHGKKIVSTICKMESDRCKIEAEPQNVISLQEHSQSERFIPRYFTPSAAGSSVPLDCDDFEMILADNSVPNDADYAVNIQGNSMEPYIHDGDMVFVKKAEELYNGEVGIFSVDGIMYCKQYYRDDSGNLTLVSANPNMRHTNVFIDFESGHTVKICGKVLLDRHISLPKYIFEN